MTKVVAMIPARLGSQRLAKKNLLAIDGVPMIARAIRKARSLGCFDEVWVNSEADEIAAVAADEGVPFHRRPPELANSQTTSEQFVYEFLTKHPCDWLVQVHSIAPLLTRAEISTFVQRLLVGEHETLLSGVDEQIQCLYQNRPINFSFTAMDLTQELQPIQRIAWSITGWHGPSYLKAYESGSCATYNGRVGFFPLSRASGIVVKFEEDFRMVTALAAAGYGD